METPRRQGASIHPLSGRISFHYVPDWDLRWLSPPRPVEVRLRGAGDDDHITTMIRSSGSFYEDPLLRFLAARGPRGGLFVDVGSNIGNHAVFFGLFLADWVMCIEPNPALAEIQRENFQANGISRYVLRICGAGDVPGTARLVVPPGQERNAGATRLVPGAALPEGPAAVPIRTLDDLVPEALAETGGRRVSLVKVDVEGMEGAVLRGARRILAEHRPHLVVELMDEPARAAAIESLHDLGYAPVGQFCDTPTYYLVSQGGSGLRPPPPRLLRSWHLGRLSRWRRRVGLLRE